MMKKIAALLLSAVMIAGILPAVAFGADIIARGECGAEGDNVTWTLDDEGTLTISGTGAMKGGMPPQDWQSVKTVVIKNGVTSIGDGAFWGCENMTSVELPDSMTSIGDAAFYICHNLTSVIIPKNVTNIEVSFYYCWGLTEVNVDPENPVYTSADGVLINKNKAELKYYPEGKTDKNYTVPDSVKSIGDGAFYRSKVTNVKIPEGVTSIGDSAFFLSSIESIEIPNSVTDIGKGAFTACNNLKSISIPYGVESIKEYTFEGCSSLESVEIPQTITEIGEAAFSGCTSLKDIYYGGTQDQWNEYFSGFNGLPESTEIHFNEFTITVNSGANGTAEASAETAEAGATITVTATPDNGYMVDEMTYTPEGGSAEDIKTNRSFIMPEANVTIEVTFKEKTAYDYKNGDINDDGDVTQTDKLILSRYLAKWDGYKNKIKNLDAADINGDGDVTQTDKLILSRYLAKWTGYDKYFN
ncbi:MAG: leucine-rich repeat protein [Firmicutes bacterium]|nr:leucine-rich repeat protein [Bacillota bacterium]